MTRRAGLRRWGRLVGLGLVVGAVVTEQRKPPAEREWHGRLGGFVPYDFRRPTLDRLRAAVWDPESPRLVKPQAFGVGWTVNVGRVARLVRERVRPDA